MANQVKAGYKTTEFWLSLGSQLLTIFAPGLPGGARMGAAAAIAVGYAISRAIAKRPTQAPQQTINAPTANTLEVGNP